VQRIKDHADLREEARKRLAAGEDSLDIARDFNGRGEPLLLARWHAATIVDYASDPRYLGARTHHGTVTAEDAWPRIVPKATHVRCLAIIAERKSKKHNSRPGKAVNWLSGTMTCEVCAVPLGSGRNKYGPYYRCVQPAVMGRYEGKGYHVSAVAAPVDTYVEGKLFEWLSSPAFVAAFAQDDEALVKRIEDAEAEVKLLRERLKGFQNKAVEGTLSAESLAAVEAGLLPKIKEAEKQARSLKTPSVVRDLIGATPGEVATAWADLALSQRRLVAETLLDVRLRKAPRGGALPVEQRVVVHPRKPAQRELTKAA
jgi:hypothetical protein